MRIGNRLFPYPLLNHEKLYSQYKERVFSLNFKEVISNSDFILNGLSFETNSSFLKDLISNGKVKVFCMVECPQTMFRKYFEISEEKSDLSIPLFDLSGKTTINAFAIAVEEIKGFKSEEFLDDYDEYTFDVEKNGIVAVDDGYTTTIDFDSEEDTKKSSIFLIIKDKNIKDELMETDVDSSKITIRLPEAQWDIYDKTKKQSKFENLYFSIIAIPALSYALGLLQKNADSVDQLCIDYKWFNSFKKKYEDINEKELTDDEFEKMNASTEAQRMLNTPNTKSISDIFDLLVMPNLGGNEND
jgi:hypothetical protein